jgi:enoyl-CoA hydratase/carnithine racemase
LADLVETSRDGNVALLRLNRPEARNALSPEMMEQIAAALEALDPDPDVRCVVIAGSEKVFAAGADIKAMAERSFAEALRHPAASFWRRLAAIKTPMVAAVSGYALGGGCELALACDMRYAASSAKLGQPEVNLGIIPGWGGTQRLARVCGLGVAKELIFTGRVIGADEAHRIGLVNAVHDPVLDKARETAALLASKSPIALRVMKELANRALGGDHAANLDAEGETFGELFSSDDAKEGLTAFVEKREPVFRGT